MSAGLDVFVPEPKRVTVARGTREVEIAPLTIRQLGPMGRAAAHFMPFVLTGDWMAALVVQAEAVIEALAIGSGLSKAEIGELPGDDLVPLATAVWEVNQDFFIRTAAAAAPMLKAMAARTEPDGARSSPGSSGADTGSTTCST